MTARKSVPPKTEEVVLRLAREGKSRAAVARETGLTPQTVSAVAQRHDIQWATVGGTNATAESMAKARGVQSEYARNRRAALSDRLLDETERTLDHLTRTVDPRQRLQLSQAAAATGKAYADLTAADARAVPEGQERALSMLDAVVSAVTVKAASITVEDGIIFD